MAYQAIAAVRIYGKPRYLMRNRKSARNVTRLVILCDASDTVGGVRKFIQDMRASMLRCGIEFKVISRYHGKRDQRAGSAADAYLYPEDYEDLLASRRTADGREAARLDDRIAQAKVAARHAIREESATWTIGTYVLAVQAGALLELLDAGYWNEAKDFTLAFQYHGTYQYAREQSYWKRLEGALKAVDQTVLLSQGDADSFAAHTSRNTAVVPNSIPVPATIKPYQTRPKRAIYMGRLEAEKTVDELIAAWDAISPEFPDWRLEIFGDGELSDALKAQASRNADPNAISFPGRTDNPSREILNSQLHLLTSHREGMPMSILEASSVGTPTVAYNASPGVEDLLGGGEAGVLIRAGDVSGFSRALRDLLRHPAKRADLSRKAHRYARKYSPEAVDSRWLEVMESAMTETRTSGTEEGVRSNDEVQYTFRIPDGISPITLRIATSAREFASKSFVLRVGVKGASSKTELLDVVRLPWSSQLNGPFIYLPPKPAGQKYVELTFDARGAGTTLTVEALRWGLRALSPARELRECFVINTSSSSKFSRVAQLQVPTPTSNSESTK